MVLSFSEIAKAHDLPLETVEVPEWGGSVYIRPLDSDGKDTYELSMLDVSEKGQGRVRALLVGLCLCDDTGKRLCPTPKDIDTLGTKSALVLDRLYSACRKLNQLDVSLDDTKKNCEPSQELGQSSESAES